VVAAAAGELVLITILGTRGNVESVARRYSKHSGILVDGLILLDAGETGYLKLHPKYVFITHLHPDHAALEAHDVHKGIEIYAPESSPRLPMIRVISQPVRVGAYTVIPIPTVHSQRVKSVGYLVENNGERFLYTSDLVKIKPRFQRLLSGLDLVVTDGSFIRSKGMIRKDTKTGLPMGHNGIPDLVRFFCRYTNRIVITHFGTWFFKDIAHSRRRIQSFGDGLEVIAAYDGMRLTARSADRPGKPLIV
jgi:ribonuclease BN (tRNA processing enzyme)